MAVASGAIEEHLDVVKQVGPGIMPRRVDGAPHLDDRDATNAVTVAPNWMMGNGIGADERI